MIVNAIQLATVNCRMQILSKYREDLINPLCNNLTKVTDNSLLLKEIITALELLCQLDIEKALTGEECVKFMIDSA